MGTERILLCERILAAGQRAIRDVENRVENLPLQDCDKKTDDGHNEFTETTDYGQSHVVLQVFLKYGPDGERVIRHISRASSPGQRVYQGYKDVKRVLDGLGIAILSTSAGVMSDRQARKAKVGGELIATVW